MPIYEYTCRDCGETFETLRSFDDNTKVECPSCGGANCLKSVSLFSATGSGNRSAAANCAPSGG